MRSSFVRSSFAFVLLFPLTLLVACSGKKEGGDEELDCTALPNGTPCVADSVDRICVNSACVAAGCGNGFVEAGEVCDDGNETAGDGCDPGCTRACEGDGDCDDGGSCNGVETCDLESHTCAAGTPTVCEAINECHVGSCDLETGACLQLLIDADGDGHAATGLGACGDDCNDADFAIYEGATEICGDGKDNNCVDGTSDENTTAWYPDCDRDGYASSGAVVTNACQPPETTAASTGCPDDQGVWTMRPPLDLASSDCADSEFEAHPDPNGTQVDFQNTPIPGTSDWDWNCDGNDEPESTVADGPGCRTLPTCGANECCESGRGQWADGTDPACGDSESFEFCGDDLTSGGFCPDDSNVQQRCR